MPSTTIAGMAHYEMLVSHSPPVFSHSPPVAFLSDYGPNVNRCVFYQLQFFFFFALSLSANGTIFIGLVSFFFVLFLVDRYFDPSRSLCRTQSLTPIQSRQKFHQLASKMPTAPKRPCLVVKHEQIRNSDSTDSKTTSSIDKK